MSSKIKYIERTPDTNAADVTILLVSAAREQRLAAFLICKFNDETNQLDTISSWPIPIEPFCGAEKHHVEQAVADCIKTHPQAHSHAISHLALSNIFKRFKSDIPTLARMWFMPIKASGEGFVFLGFPHPERKVIEKTIPQDFTEKVLLVVEYMAATGGIVELTTRMRAMELYVKEIGHDIASSVQSTIAKLNNISEGLVPKEFVIVKAREAEQEIMSAYRAADNLGLTMEANYQIREFTEFTLLDVTKATVDHRTAEAKERNLTLEIRGSFGAAVHLGDPKAMELAIGHYISNAIKYSFGNTKVQIDLSTDGEYSLFKISNLGISLPEGKAANKIWDFGFRADEAKGRHVNGSGIGLYTVKKIILAHHGHVDSRHDKSTKLTIFSFRIPTASYLKKSRPDVYILGRTRG